MASSPSKRREAPQKGSRSPAAVDSRAFDPVLSSLFASSLGPVKAPPKSRYGNVPEPSAADDASSEEEDSDDETAESEDDGASTADAESSNSDAQSDAADAADANWDAESASEESPSDGENEEVLAKVRESMLKGTQDKSKKKRKRGDQEEVEDVYMRKVAQQEDKEDEKRRKKPKTQAPATKPAHGTSDQSDGSGSDKDEDEDEDENSLSIPVHETLMEKKDSDSLELEKAARTVFLGNVSSDAVTSKVAQKTLKKHLVSFIPDLADSRPPHKIESIRYRSTAFASALPKRAAFAKKEVMESTTKSTNAYAVYSTQVAAREAVKRLNGTIVLGRHLRVDSIAHPAKIDHRRCVYVGNLGFVDDESKLNAEDDKKKKNKPPGDVEEGLWVQFSKAGTVESVRVVRDSKTRVGKGFAYVQFEDENGVEAALQFNDQKFPPLLPRKLRVVRCKAQKKHQKNKKSGPPPLAKKSKSHDGKPNGGVYNAKLSNEEKSKQGRARAMLGKSNAFKSAESFVFEGHRASSKQGKSGLKFGGGGGGSKKKGPNGRKSRSAAWKAGGGKR